MTVGQRIAQKRKELDLSQEGLGERLGVSRQAIYKWESDAALPAQDLCEQTIKSLTQNYNQLL